MLNIINATHPELLVVFRPAARAYLNDSGSCVVLAEVENLSTAEGIRAFAVLKGKEGELLAIEEKAVAALLPGQAIPLKFELSPVGGEAVLVELHLTHEHPRGNQA